MAVVRAAAQACIARFWIGEGPMLVTLVAPEGIRAVFQPGPVEVAVAPTTWCCEGWSAVAVTRVGAAGT